MLMVPSGSPPQLATYFVKSNISRDVGYWGNNGHAERVLANLKN
jgi:hypothetical protein